MGYITLADANGGRTDFDSTAHEWRNYIDNNGQSNNADAATCETACTAADKKCNFFIYATVSGNIRCYFGRFARDASSVFAGLEAGAAIQTGIRSDGVVKLKKGLLLLILIVVPYSKSQSFFGFHIRCFGRWHSSL